MHYLWWYVPTLTSPMLIALVASIHVFVSHYAVGGGIFLACETAAAHRAKDNDYLRYLHSHTKFFVLLTIVFGAITGVGIWWTIGLASPLATEFLIRTFVFAWGMEWVLFLVELVAAFLFFYRWGKVAPNIHCAFGWIYALAAWGSLVLITGITAFMLQPGAWVAQTEAGLGEPNLALAFFNPQFLPQTLARTGASLVLAGVYVLLHASWTLRDEKRTTPLRARVVRHASLFSLVGTLLGLLGTFWAWSVLDPIQQETIHRAAALNIFLGVGVGAVALLGICLVLAYRRPQWNTPIAAFAMFALSLGALASAEFVREAVRKPFVISNVILSNQIHLSQLDSLREKGLLQSGVWTNQYVRHHYPQLVSDNGTFRLKDAQGAERIDLGRVVFMHHCNDCHAEGYGYSGMAPLAYLTTKEEWRAFLPKLNSMVWYMPPWSGNADEVDLLADYLVEKRSNKDSWQER
ncbi:MAG: cytochrome ubiquinol oxidase subunit I [Planctomycetia bacterium]|nr:cytochrome ubiquinol oxidase subunit I [Planctomycetia bacterium]